MKNTTNVMTNILIVYDSKTGNTEKMAKLVSEGVREIDSTEVRLRKAEDASVKDVDWCDGLAIVLLLIVDC